MTYSGLVSGYMWSKKAKIKDNLIFFLSKKYCLNFLSGVDLFLCFFLIISACIYIHVYQKKSNNLLF
jgi:hypothetical protein